MYKPNFFSESEFERCVPSCSMSDMNENLLIRLDVARHIYGEPMIINSAYRSPEYEVSMGRVGTSSHCKGMAVDIRCTNINNRLRLVRALLMAGFIRIGISEVYVHADIDSLKPSCLWLYSDK